MSEAGGLARHLEQNGLLACLRDVTVIVVTYNSAHCLPSLGKLLALCPNIAVVDNGSGDDTAAEVARYLPHARFMALGRNYGFGAANNRALQEVRTPFAFLLNPDCEITAEGIAGLLGVAEDYSDAAVIAPQLVQPGGQLETNYRWPHSLWTSRGMGATGPACVGFLCGAAMLFRIAAFKGIGFFDEDYFLYYEDDDLCLRLFNARRQLIVAPEVMAVHRSRGSVRGPRPLHSEYLRGYHHAQSKLIYTSKHESVVRARAQRRWLLWTTALLLPLRMLLSSPRLSARMVGRLRGVLAWRHFD